jgi:hypothetical protein
MARRLSAEANSDVDLPAEMLAPFEAILEKHKEELMAGICTTLRTAAASFDRTADLKVADARRKLAQAERESTELLTSWATAEQDRDQAWERNAALEEELARSRAREQELKGRLAQLAETHQTLLDSARDGSNGSNTDASDPRDGTASSLRGTDIYVALSVEPGDIRTSGAGNPSSKNGSEPSLDSG